jgi:signal transduction histidine kinase
MLAHNPFSPPKLNALFADLAAHQGLYCRSTFKHLAASLLRMVRDWHLQGLVICHNPQGSFGELCRPLQHLEGLTLYTLNEPQQPAPQPFAPSLLSEHTGFLLIVTNRLSAALYWQHQDEGLGVGLASGEGATIIQGGWSFQPMDVRSLAQEVATLLEDTHLQQALAAAPMDRRYDEKLSWLVASLVSHLEQRNRDLTHAMERVGYLNQQMLEQERLAAIGQLSSTLAHEIRNPLGLIDLYAQLVETQLGLINQQHPQAPPLPEGIFGQLGQIRQATQDLEGILGELTQYARPLQLACEPCPIWPWLQEVAAFYQPQFEAEGVKLVVENTVSHAQVNDDLTLPVDSRRLKQALINLLKNALEASTKGPNKTVWLTLACRSSDDALYIKVKDEGGGIAMEKRAKLFTPFFSTKAQGTGLGLAYVRKIVQAHGGRAELLWSEPEKGSTFALILPLALAATAAEPHGAKQPAEALTPPTAAVMAEPLSLQQALEAEAAMAQQGPC